MNELERGAVHGPTLREQESRPRQNHDSALPVKPPFGRAAAERSHKDPQDPDRVESHIVLEFEYQFDTFPKSS